MKAMLDRRYNPEMKLLDLSAYEQDPEFANTGVFSKPSTRAKFFPALMKVCENIPKEMVTGVILSNNKLKDLTPVTALPQTFPDLKNLDLSNNEMFNLDPLWDWRRKLLSLEHLIVSGNPLEKHMKAGWEDKIKRWYQQLRILNTTEVRPAAPGAAVTPAPPPAAAAPAPPAPQVTPAGPQQGLVLPDGFGAEVPGKAPEQVQKELMAIEVSKATNMTLQYSIMCLEQSNWDMKRAEEVYVAAKPTLPPDAFFTP
jgi:nuclear RNA export factor